MAYCTKEQLITRFGTHVNTLSGMDDAVISAACKSASAELDGYMESAGYAVPLARAPEIVSVHAGSIAMYRLLVRAGMLPGELDGGQAPIVEDYKAAVRFGEQVARGALRLRSAMTAHKDTAHATRRVVRAEQKLPLGRFV